MNERDPLSVAVFGAPGLLGGSEAERRAKPPVVEERIGESLLYPNTVAEPGDMVLLTNAAARSSFPPFSMLDEINSACRALAVWPPPLTPDEDLPFAEEIPEAPTDDIMKDYRPS